MQPIKYSMQKQLEHLHICVNDIEYTWCAVNSFAVLFMNRLQDDVCTINDGYR